MMHIWHVTILLAIIVPILVGGMFLWVTSS